MKNQIILEPFKSPSLLLRNRIAMAPLTRCRAENNIPSSIHVKYYKQRATAGLIISEGAQISPMAVGYPDTPGIHSKAQIEGWKKVTETVHKEGGKIYIQLWHVGSISHPLFLNGNLPLAPSAVQPDGLSRTKEGKKPHPIPKEMSLDDIRQTLEDFAEGAQNAIEAGFDGVEIHGANGYLINQFLCDSSNKRTDQYGGDIKNRCQFALEVVEAVSQSIGSEKTGIRLSPGGIGHDIMDSNAKKLFEHLINSLNNFDLAYLHLMEPYVNLSHIPNSVQGIAKHFRPLYNGNLMINNGFDQQSGNKVIEEGYADMVAYGKLFISNPDLVKRFELNAPLNPWDESTFYSLGEKGYTDYTCI